MPRVPQPMQLDMRDVIAIVTAVAGDDMDAAFAVIEGCDDPRAVLAGLAGFVAEALPAWVASLDLQEDFLGAWSRAAVEVNRRMDNGEPI